MTIIKFSSEVMDKHPEVYSIVADSYVNKFVTYMIDSEYRKAVELKPWINDQVANPTQELKTIADVISTGVSYDDTMRNILIWTIRNIQYRGDNDIHKKVEFWQTAQQTVDLKTGDCEDGAILIYVLARLKGVPDNRLLIAAGDVFDPFTKKVAGHAWCIYRPSYYPLNWAFMDWCYYPNKGNMDTRNLYYIKDKAIYGYVRQNGDVVDSDEMYKTLWFAFNENKSHLKLVYHRQD